MNIRTLSVDEKPSQRGIAPLSEGVASHYPWTFRTLNWERIRALAELRILTRVSYVMLVS
jgi:hypothetical protein